MRLCLLCGLVMAFVLMLGNCTPESPTKETTQETKAETVQNDAGTSPEKFPVETGPEKATPEKVVEATPDLAPAKAHRTVWAKGIGSAKRDRAYNVTQDGKGNAYVMGSYEAEIKIGTTTLPLTPKVLDIFVAKIDAEGKWVWATSFAPGGSFDKSLVVDKDGNVHITGTFGPKATLGQTTLTAKGTTDIFVAKLDSNGKWLWAKRAGGKSEIVEEFSYGIALDSKGNVAITGSLGAPSDFDAITLTPEKLSQPFVAKLDSSGKWLWAKMVGGFGGGTAIAVDNKDNIISAGNFSGTATFGSLSLTSTAGIIAYVAKLDSEGKWLWAKSFGGDGPGDDSVKDVTIDASDNILLTGVFYGTAKIGDTTITWKGSGDIYVLQMSSAGEWQWAISAGAVTDGEAKSVGVDAKGNIYVAGIMKGETTFGDTTLPTQADNTPFVASISNTGKWLWAKQAIALSYSPTGDISVAPDGTLYVVGSFEKPATFDEVPLTSAGGLDGYIWKLAP